LLGSAYLSDGETGKGLEILERAVAVDPDIAGIRTQLAIARLRQGDINQAITELQSAIDLGKDQVQADLLLVMAHLKNKDFDDAIAATGLLMAKMPDSPIPLNMKGAALLGKGDYKAARQAFESALEKQPGFISALLNLAQIDMLEGDNAAAKKHYQQVLSNDQGHLKTLVALARLAVSEGNTEDAIRWLVAARKHHPEAIEPALLLSNNYLRQGQVQDALDVTRTIAVEHPGNPAVLIALALVQKQAGEDNNALRTFRSLVEVAPRSAEAHYQLALMQYKLKQTDAARDSLKQAIALQDDHLAARIALGRLEIAVKDLDRALAIAASIKETHPDVPEGYELEGDVLFAQQESAEAARVYATAYDKSSSAQLARKIFRSHMKTGNADAAYDALRNWLDKHPGDSTTRTLLASKLQKAGQRQLALDEYLRILENDPDNVTALNNVAWLYQETGKSEGVQYAERAHALVPDRPEVTDTLGWLLVQNGDINRGLVLLQEARIKAPHIPDIHYHMAVALYKAGRTDEARKELDRLLKAGKTFPGLESAKALRDQLVNK
jgi:putative PEP-CTERM system TPR-repeat lipoprotein